MAWITVDQKLLGGKLRELAKRLNSSQNEAIGILIRLWLWGIDNTEESGAIVAGERADIAEAIRPGFLNPPEGRIQDVVEALIECQWIDERDGRLYLHDWLDWRQLYTSYISGKEKHAARMRDYRSSKKSSTENGGKPKKTAKKNPYTEGFEAFWSAYPRKVEKGNAYKKYQARLNDGFAEAELLQAAMNYRAECQRKKTDPSYIKHPKTFLSDTTPFIDYLDKNTGEPQKTPAQGENPFI